jgi:hypothetical protein
VQTIAGVRAFANAFGSAASHGPYLRGNIILTGPDVTELLNIATGKPGHAFDQIDDPPLYTAADCPRYQGMSGPNCGASAAAASASAIRVRGNEVGATGSAGSAEELAAVRSVAAQVTHLPPSQIPDLADLLLGPLLRGSVTVIQ